MTDVKYTPGPWSINTWKHQNDPSIRIGAEGTPLVAQVPSTFVSINEWRANAKLIAAAPELLESLNRLDKAAMALADAASFEFKNEQSNLFADLHNIHLSALEVITKATE